MDKLTKKGLDGTQLKTIALVLMVLDHIHYFFEFTGCIPTVFSMLGRLSAPLFLFCTVEGFAHTHDRKRYFIRIWAIGTAMAALEFFMIYAKAFRRGDDFYPQNAIFQDLMLLCIVWQGIDWLREKKLAKGERKYEKKKEKAEKEALKLFSVEIVLTPDSEDHMQMEANIQGHKSEMKAFLETLDVNPEEYRSISKHAANAMLRDFVQQVVNLSESLEGAEMEPLED